MRQIELLYGRGQVCVPVPPDADVIMPREVPALEDFETRFIHALDNPTGLEPLSSIARASAGQVCIIVNDPTRLANSHKFLPLLLDYLNACGVPDSRMYIVFALGSHRPLTQREIEETVSPKVMRRVACHNHDAVTSDALVWRGTTSRGTPVWLNKLVASSELRILTGSIVHHFFAGFGGGRKALVPGVAGVRTIQKNHSMMLAEGATIGRLCGNPVHEDLLEAAQMCGGGFLINVVLNEAKQFTGIFAGDMVKAHEEGCAFVEYVNGVHLPQLADVVIAGCGGYPKDINMYQAQKTLDNAAQAVRPGGQIVLVAECEDGVGSDTYLEWARKYKSLPELEQALRANFVLGGHKAYAVTKLQARATVHLVSRLAQPLVRELGFSYAPSARHACEEAYASAGANPRVLVMPQGSITVPKATQ